MTVGETNCLLCDAGNKPIVKYPVVLRCCECGTSMQLRFFSREAALKCADMASGKNCKWLTGEDCKRLTKPANRL